MVNGPSLRVFIYDIRNHGFRVALNNLVLCSAMRFIGASGYHVEYADSDECRCLAGEA